MTLRVLILHERFAPDSGGGGEYAALKRARGLMDAGCDVQVMCPGNPADTQVEGIPIRRLRLPRQLAILMAPAAIRAARKADIIHSFTYYAAPAAWIAGRIAGKPVVCEQLGLFGPAWRDMRPGLAGRMLEGIERMQIRIPFDAHIFLSPASEALARQQGFRGKGIVLSPGLDPLAQTSVPKSDPPRVLFAGKFDHRKGLDRFYALARALPAAQFEAVGWSDGAAPPPPPANLTLIEGRGQIYHDALARASILVMPSRAETFGLVIYEAMQASCSVISTIDAGFKGALLDPWDADAAIDALRCRLQDPHLTAAEGKENQARARAFTWSKSTEGVLNIYHKLLESN